MNPNQLQTCLIINEAHFLCPLTRPIYNIKDTEAICEAQIINNGNLTQCGTEITAVCAATRNASTRVIVPQGHAEILSELQQKIDNVKKQQEDIASDDSPSFHDIHQYTLIYILHSQHYSFIKELVRLRVDVSRRMMIKPWSTRDDETVLQNSKNKKRDTCDAGLNNAATIYNGCSYISNDDQRASALFELMIKSMCEYLYWSGAHEAPAQARFPDQFTDDVPPSSHNVTTEIISSATQPCTILPDVRGSIYGCIYLVHQIRQEQPSDAEPEQQLAFFLFDLHRIADRGYVFNLVRGYHKQMSAKIASLPDAVPLVQYKLAFLRIVCSHEHYVSLSLPAGGAGSGAAPPAPSLASHASHASHSSAPPPHALSHEHRSRHYLTGLLLHDLTAALELQSPVLQCGAVNAVLSLLTAHDADPRLQAARSARD
ncbi:LOW QUALITY PROTEIN: hypothetical protein MSG28_001972 [Choristoneura fumiferana]|uniref:Uncharacterized protein n=1 Tax=Choristoneura fumiferana TaxID=7141 RepID=A0ACC0JTS3_CHOFU|nr:LOW QUALITY PROTEIN: hypothetical protein MSG28_001972 [Choristoneura fumiferana]